MSPVSVVTDSTSYLPPDLIERNRIAVVPLYVVFGGDRTVPEVEITDYPAFFEELRSAEKLPTTSQPSVGDFTAVFEPLLANGGEVVSVHISGGLSGTPEAARQAKDALTRDGRGGERIEVVDSKTAAGGLGFMVLAAARAARDSTSAKEVAEHVAAARKELRLWFAIDTLEFLKRGGRIGAASAWIGSTLKVKPILTVENEMSPVERVRTSSRAFERLVEYARSCSGLGRRRVVGPAHKRARPVRAARGALHRDLRARADDRERDRPRAVGPHGAGPARHGRRAEPLRGLAPTGGAPDGANTALMINVRDIVRIVLTVVCVVITLYLLWTLRKPIGWLLAAIFLATALSPPVNWLSRRMRRGFAIAITYMGLLLVPILLIALIVPPLISQGNTLADHVPRYADDVTNYVQKNRTLRNLNEDYDITTKLQKEAGKLPSRLGGAAGTLRDIGLGIVNSLFALLTILVMTAFILGSGRRWTDQFIGSRPPEQRERLRRSLDNISSAVSGYVAGALTIAFIAGTATFIVLSILGVPFAGPLAVMAGLASLIPLVGATIAAVIIGLVTVFNDFPTDTIIWIVWAIAYQQIENNLIQPQIQKRTVNVQPLITIFAVLCGATLLGVVGAIAAIPIAASIQILLREYVDLRTFSMRPHEPEPPPAEPAPA